MTKELKQSFLLSLRSGRYVQCTGRLSKGPNTYCALGLLGLCAELTINSTGTEFNESQDNGSEDDDSYFALYKYISKVICNELWEMNDLDKMSFADIADWVETNIETSN